MDKLTVKDKIAFGILFIIIALFFSYVIYTRMSSGNNDYKVSAYNFDTQSYDVEIINSASYDDFLAVKGIGESKATAIIEYREALGGFDSVYQLKDLNAVGDKLFETILDHFYGEDDDELPEVIPESTSASLAVSQSSTVSVTTVQSHTTYEQTSASIETTSESVTTTKELTTVSEAAANDEITEEEAETVIEEEEEVVEEVDDEEVTEQIMTSVEINYATAEEIARCLLIDLSLAEEIVQLRQNIGGFTRLQELTLCENLTIETYKIISKFIIIS